MIIKGMSYPFYCCLNLLMTFVQYCILVTWSLSSITSSYSILMSVHPHLYADVVSSAFATCIVLSNRISNAWTLISAFNADGRGRFQDCDTFWSCRGEIPKHLICKQCLFPLFFYKIAILCVKDFIIGCLVIFFYANLKYNCNFLLFSIFNIRFR